MTHTITTHDDKSEIEIHGTIPWEEFVSHEAAALQNLGSGIEIDGFRKGTAPADVLRTKIDDTMLLTDMAEAAISAFYVSVAKENNLQVIGRPNVQITKIARGNPLEFTITSAVLPDIKLPSYKKIAGAVALPEPKPVTDADVEKVLEDLRQLRAYGHVHAPGDAHAHTEELPPLDDTFAKSFGNFATLDDLRVKVRENLLKEHDRDTHDKRRIEIIEGIMEKTDVIIPEILIAAEQEKMFAQIESDIARSGHTFEAYLAEIKKTKEEIAAEYKPEASKRAKMQLIINAIAKDAGVSVSDEEMTTEAQKIMQTYPGADLERAKAYADMILTNEKVMNMLEGEK